MIGLLQVSKICQLPWNVTAEQNINLHHRENLICDKIFINLQYKSTLSLFNQIFSALSEKNWCPCTTYHHASISWNKYKYQI